MTTATGFICDKCGEPFVSQTAYERHLRYRHRPQTFGAPEKYDNAHPAGVEEWASINAEFYNARAHHQVGTLFNCSPELVKPEFREEVRACLEANDVGGGGNTMRKSAARILMEHDAVFRVLPPTMKEHIERFIKTLDVFETIAANLQENRHGQKRKGPGRPKKGQKDSKARLSQGSQADAKAEEDVRSDRRRKKDDAPENVRDEGF